MPGVLLIGFRSANGGYTVVSAANPLPVTGGGGGGGGGDVNLTQINGVATAVGAGNVSTGTQRVVIATDQPASTAAVTAAAYSGADASEAAMIRAIADAAIATAPTLVSRAPYTVRRVITPGTNVTAGQGVMIACTVAGIQQLELSSGDVLAVPVVIGTSFFDNLAVIDAPSSGTTATATVTVLAVS